MLKEHGRWIQLDLSGTFLVGVDVDGTLDMRPGPIAKKHLGCSRFQVVNKDLDGDDAHINTDQPYPSGGECPQTSKKD